MFELVAAGLALAGSVVDPLVTATLEYQVSISTAHARMAAMSSGSAVIDGAAVGIGDDTVSHTVGMPRPTKCGIRCCMMARSSPMLLAALVGIAGADWGTNGGSGGANGSEGHLRCRDECSSSIVWSRVSTDNDDDHPNLPANPPTARAIRPGAAHAPRPCRPTASGTRR